MQYVHTSIVAEDWKRLADFYAKVFKCRFRPPERKLEGEWLERATGLKGAALEGVHLSLPGHGVKGPTLEIFTYRNIKKIELLSAAHKGFTHIAFQVDNVGAVLEKALENGGEKLGKITEKEVKGAGKLEFVYFRDPEGNIVEIQSWS